LLRKAFAAVNRTVLTGLERNLGFATASSTSSGEPLSFAAGGVFASIPAGFATLGFIYETFFSVEFLFSGGEYEFISAFFAGESFVFEHDFFTSLENISYALTKSRQTK
jgi:hypothetical protein